jgi:formylglycine-generating enzyme required for sulfatase activity
MVRIPAGTFLMGAKADPFASSQPSADEQPQHQVSVKAFAMGKYEVTQEQWYAVMGTTPSQFKGRTLPVEQVSWEDAQEFVKKLSVKTGKNYRLPSEAEWEYAARAGTQTAYSFGDNEGDLGRHAWFSQNSNRTTHPVGEKQSNSFGLHDMHGNVWEWTQDCWNGNYNAAPTDGSVWTTGNCSLRVVRGGSWSADPRFLRAAFRFMYSSASVRSLSIGFRVVRTD